MQPKNWSYVSYNQENNVIYEDRIMDYFLIYPTLGERNILSSYDNHKTCWFIPIRSGPDKINLRPETRIERLGLISNPTSEISSSKSRPEIRIDPNPKLSTKLLILTWQVYWTKNWLTQTKVHPTRTKPTRNVI